MPIRYHYMDVQFVEDNLTRQRIKFSKIADFNDKFECCPETAQDYLQRHPAILFAGVVRFELQMVAQEINDRIGVLCLSNRGNNYLLWSHYAHKHTGVAIGIEVNHPCFNPAFLKEQVSYDRNRPQVDWDDFTASQARMILHLRAILSKKDKPWDYRKSTESQCGRVTFKLSKACCFCPFRKTRYKK